MLQNYALAVWSAATDIRVFAAAMVHELFLMKCGVEHLRKLGRIGITNNEASDVA
jgi:hypothetical protein